MTLQIIENTGVTLTKEFPQLGHNERLESTVSVLYEGEKVMDYQINKDGTYNIFQFNDVRLNITVESLIELIEKHIKVS